MKAIVWYNFHIILFGRDETMKIKLVLILILGILATSLSGCSEKTAAATAKTDVWQTVSDAYVYCLPQDAVLDGHWSAPTIKKAI
jgi:hypothetical protein